VFEINPTPPLFSVGKVCHGFGFPASYVEKKNYYPLAFDYRISGIHSITQDHVPLSFSSAKLEDGTSGSPILNSENMLIGIHAREIFIAPRPGYNSGFYLTTDIDLKATPSGSF
jgi:hypothetical protein